MTTTDRLTRPETMYINEGCDVLAYWSVLACFTDILHIAHWTSLHIASLHCIISSLVIAALRFFMFGLAGSMQALIARREEGEDGDETRTLCFLFITT